MPSEVLRCRVHHNVDSMLQRSHQRRRAKGIVDTNQDIFCMGNVCQLAEIRNTQARIPDRLCPDQSGLFVDRILHGGRIGHIDQSDGNAGPIANFVKQPIGTAIQVTSSHHMIPGFEHHGHAMDRCHPR